MQFAHCRPAGAKQNFRGRTRLFLAARPLAIALLIGANAAGIGLDGAHAADEPAADSVALRDFDVPAGELAGALNRFAEQSGWQLIYPSGLTSGRNTTGLKGRYAPQDGLQQLLRDTGLRGRRTAPSTMTLEPSPSTGQSKASVLAPVYVEGQVIDEDENYRTAGSVSTVTREQLDRLPVTSTRDVLADFSGVWVQDGRQNPALNVNIRGLQDQGRINMMIDGARQNLQVVNGHNGINQFVYIDPELIGDVTVEKGPTSMARGAAQIGGSVNMRTLEPRDVLEDGKDSGGRARLIVGDNGYRAAGSIVGATRLGERTEVLGAISRRDSKDYTAGSENPRLRPIPSGSDGPDSELRPTVEPGEKVPNTFQESTSGLLKAVSRIDDEQTLKLGAMVYRGEYGQQDLATRGGAVNEASTHTLTTDYRLDSSKHQWIDLDTHLWYTAAEVERPEYATTYKMSSYGGEATNATPVRLRGIDLVLRYGGEFFHDSGESVTDDLEGYGAITASGDRNIVSGFGRAELMRGDWLEFIAGLRYDWYGLQGSGRYLAPILYGGYVPFTVDRHEGKFSPRVSLALTPWQGVQFYGLYSQGLRPPAIGETVLGGCHGSCQGFFPFLPNPELRPERASNWETGLNLMQDDLWLTGDKLRAKLTYFSSRVKNFITFNNVYYPVGGVSDYALRYENIANADYQGWDLQGSYDAGFVFAQATLTKFNVQRYCWRGECEGSRGFYNPPNRSARATLGVRLWSQRATLGTRVRYDSAATNAGYRDSATIFDLFGSLQLLKSFQLGFAVENVGDVYYTDALSNVLIPAPGRTAKGTLTLFF